ncbi:TetR/AcrR family transcriptional regulator [Streptomyces sp. NBC_00287]|uniref:TetR/AcrR family transcriptional regulator n=1 Tax=Streptomyces sp. NBC_00287 TaxID=2975702 RepID=UPI002E2E0F24|nr:TetR/AcrR family transcriptional regulator [Streptomyces sp. NBC_00287]
MEPKETRRTYAVGDERRSRILDAAVEHFAQWGFHASSLARIAKDVGITQGGLLHHFRSKEDLLVQVLERTEQQDREKFFAEEFASATECYAGLLRLTEYNAARLGRTRMFNVLLAEAGDVGHPAHTYFVRRYTELVAVMSASLQLAVESGELKPDTDVVDIAEETAAVMDGLQLQWLLDPKGFDMVTRFRQYADRLLRSVKTDGTGLPS